MKAPSFRVHEHESVDESKKSGTRSVCCRRRVHETKRDALVRFRTTRVRERIVEEPERRHEFLGSAREFDVCPFTRFPRARYLRRPSMFARAGVTRLPRARVLNLHATTPLPQNPSP